MPNHSLMIARSQFHPSSTIAESLLDHSSIIGRHNSIIALLELGHNSTIAQSQLDHSFIISLTKGLAVLIYKQRASRIPDHYDSCTTICIYLLQNYIYIYSAMIYIYTSSNVRCIYLMLYYIYMYLLSAVLGKFNSQQSFQGIRLFPI